MKTPVLIVIIASVVVLLALPAIYILLAYHTYKERQRWKVDHDVAIEKMEALAQFNPRAASAASHSIYSSSAPGRASSARQYPAPSRPAPAHTPGWAPLRPPRELDVFNSSRDYLSSQADAAPFPAPQGSGRNTKRPAPGPRSTRGSGGGRSSRAFEKKQQQPRPESSLYGATSDENSRKTRPLPPASLLEESAMRDGMAPSEEEVRVVAIAQEEEEAGKEDRQGDEKLAQKLLKPRRRAQIEVWLGETVGRCETQNCTAGRLFGHHSDLLTPSATVQPDQVHSSAPVGGDDICPVCGRSFEDEKSVVTQPEKKDQPPDSGKSGKGKHMFRGIRAAMGQFRGRDGGKVDQKDEEERWDRAISTQMFLADASEYGSSVDTGISSSGPFGFGGCENKALEERMARLMRAQKLLDKSQANGDKARRTDILL